MQLPIAEVVIGFNVAVNDAAPMQSTHGTRQLEGVLDDFRNRDPQS